MQDEAVTVATILSRFQNWFRCPVSHSVLLFSQSLLLIFLNTVNSASRKAEEPIRTIQWIRHAYYNFLAEDSHGVTGLYSIINWDFSQPCIKNKI